MIYSVFVDSHSHYQDESERYLLGVFDGYETAVTAARRVVNDCLIPLYRPSMTAESLFEMYSLFGEEPFIVPNAGNPPFSAWSYAQAHCQALCSVEV